MKPPDPLLKAVSQRILEEDDLADPRWNALAAGEASESEAAALRARSERGEAHPLAYEAFRPLDAAERDAMAEALFAGLQKQAAGSGAEKAEGAPEGSAPRSGVTPIRRSRPVLFRALAVAAPLAAAAVLALFLRAATPAPIPRYAALIEGGQSAQRATPAQPAGEPVHLGGDQRIRLILRPATEVEGPIAARAFVARSGRVRALAVAVESKPHGSLLVPEIRADLLGDDAAPGACELVFAVGRPEALPSDAELSGRIAAGSEARPDEAFRLLRVPILLDPLP